MLQSSFLMLWYSKLRGVRHMNYIFPKLKKNSSNTVTEQEKLHDLINELYEHEQLDREDYLYVLNNMTEEDSSYLFSRAFEKKEFYYGNKVYLRGLIEISNYCKMGCKYCGINYKVDTVERYRLTKDEIIHCCEEGYHLGYRTFVLQGGEDSFYTDDYLVEMLHSLKLKHKDIRITLSLGERSKESYQKLYDAGADRYLLRHETASRRLYNHLHPSFMSFDNRRVCLNNLKEIGYQVGGGMMIGSPTQTNEDLVEDLLYLKELNPHMVGVGPYLCHSDTELRGNDSGTLLESLVMVALVRLILPKALLPSTTALGTLSAIGREKALKAGANVMMPNISPSENRIKYEIYQNKICTTDTSGQCRNCIEGRIIAFDHEIDLGVGDYVGFERKNRHD
jgi:biotin synthase